MTGTAGLRLRLRAEACLLAAIARAAVRWLPLPRAVRLLGALPGVNGAPDPLDDTPDDCLAAASEGAARCAHSTCLYRALVTYALLRRRRHDAVFHLDVSRQDGFSAHAWVSAGGVRLDPPEGGVYGPLWRSRTTPDARA